MYSAFSRNPLLCLIIFAISDEFNDFPDICLPSLVNSWISLAAASEFSICDILAENVFPLDKIEAEVTLALLDLIAYIAQSLSFRVDLNARENFLETAERRDSILRLARLIYYNAKRNQPATGLLKIDSVSTTQDVLDSTGTNLSNQTIIWNDSANSNYREQFISILNAANQVASIQKFIQ